MRSPLLLVSILSLSFSYSSRAQEYSYAHYDIADGLASSTVYCITQDKDGFIWVGTEAGVCRFDGTHFQTFTTSDGLPDAEILQLFADSKGRIWMAPFRGSVCYFYQGRVHNLENDSLLARIGNREEVNKFAEDGHGDIALLQRTSVTVVRPDGAVKRYDSAGGEPMTKSVGISRSVDGNFNVQIDQRLFRLSRKGFSAFRSISFPNDHPNYISLSPKWGVWRSGSFEVT
ncbi:MAG TPA: two-component regulator propeller domain-containing protein, partial [Puia sp.]|nr:two-component regulator propeller domain-containing protein [Puia sp.]